MLQIVCCDVDGVLADFATAYQRLKERVFAKELGVSEKMLQDFKASFWKNPPYDFWYGLRPIVTSEVVNEALKDHRIVYVTNCPNATARRDWLKDHGFMRRPDTLLVVNPPATIKKELLTFFDPKMFIDDDEKQVEAAREAKISTYHISYEGEEPWVEWKQIEAILQQG